MHKAKHILLGMALVVFLSCAHAEDYLLYWQVLDTATVEGVAINEYVSTYAQTYNNFDEGGHSGKIAGARTVFFDANGNGPSLMNIYQYIEGSWRDTGFTDTFINDKDTPTTVVGTGGGMYSHFTASDPNELSFAIELGNWENGEWVALATSGTMSYSSMTVTSQDGMHILQMADDITLANFQPWSPNAYNVPEPSSGLLMLIGASLLALRRRRR
ncbi:MAG: PEP-CTERM sorting domain-containing protein [Kiritimatiellae bacterium]|nr:PEP-CTERM sorting domain-containing protein [Kiritimatiellia bacterium]